MTRQSPAGPPRPGGPGASKPLCPQATAGASAVGPRPVHTGPPSVHPVHRSSTPFVLQLLTPPILSLLWTRWTAWTDSPEDRAPVEPAPCDSTR
jgi:hypothetical protein